MQKRVVAGAAVVLLLVGLMVTSTASAQADAPPSTLVQGPTDVFLLADGGLSANETDAEGAAICMQAGAAAQSPQPTREFQTHFVHTTPGNFYPIGDSVTLDLDLSSSSDQTQSAQHGSGFTITATLGWGEESSQSDAVAFAAGGSSDSASIPIPIPGADNLTAGAQFLTVTVEIAVESPGGLPAETADVGVVCSTQATSLSAFEYALGIVGDGDLDGDGLPDSEDDDRDGDGVPNEQEEGLTCGTLDDANFADDPDLQPEPADSDGDGQSDEFECANAGGDPKSQAVMVPEPAGFPWGLVILLLIILLLIAAIVFIVLKFGRVADLYVVSQDELIIEPGETGKFEVATQSRRASGDAITLQIVVEGMPEGWDAKTDVDHVTVEPKEEDAEEAEAQTFFLTVEAPEHDDPESAVVTVKAIPLNKQGRKDTFKLAAKTETITSINVPPDAKVPVKRGGPVKLKSEEEPEPMGIPPEGLPLTDLPGLGEATAKKLKDADVETTEQLRTADLTELAKATKLDAEELGKFHKMSDLVRVPGVSPEEAEVLVENDVGSPKELSEKKPDEIEAMFPTEEPADAEIEIEGAGA